MREGSFNSQATQRSDLYNHTTDGQRLHSTHYSSLTVSILLHTNAHLLCSLHPSTPPFACFVVPLPPIPSPGCLPLLSSSLWSAVCWCS